MFNQNTQIEGLKTQLQRKRTNYLQNTTQKIKDRATRTQPKIGGFNMGGRILVNCIPRLWLGIQY
jgi:hypothetical protein